MQQNVAFVVLSVIAFFLPFLFLFPFFSFFFFFFFLFFFFLFLSFSFFFLSFFFFFFSLFCGRALWKKNRFFARSFFLITKPLLWEEELTVARRTVIDQQDHR